MRKLIFLWCFCFLFNHSGTIYGQAEELTLLGRWFDDELVGTFAFNNTYNEIWGIVVNDREFAIIGSTAGTHFIDVTDPLTPTEVAMIPGADNGVHIIHRDYHDYNGYLYAVADEGNSTLQIMDITGLPDTVEVKYNSREFIRRSHNIFIDSTSARLYSFITAGTNIPFTPMSIFDISDPVNPSLIATYNRFGEYAVSQVHDGYVQNDTAYLNCGPRGFVIVDFEVPASPHVLSILQPNEYPQSGYNHSGWLSVDGTHYYMADENHGRDIKVLNVEDFTDIYVTDTIDAESTSNQIPHNQLVACDYLYSSYYYDGLQVYDISDPAHPKRSHYYPTSQLDNIGSFHGAWGVYPFLPSGNILVSDMQEGLFVLQGVGDQCNQVSTNIENIENEQIFTLFPNPCSTHLDINLTNKDLGTKSLQILDMQGKLILEKTFSETELRIALEGISQGQYVFRLNTDKGNSSRLLTLIKE